MEQLEILLPGAMDHGFDYLAPAEMKLRAGDIVTVPFGKNQKLGIVWGAGTAKVAPGKIKPVTSHLAQFPPLPEAMRAFVDWAAWYNCAAKGAILKMVLPIDDIIKEGQKKTRAHIEMDIDTGKIELAALSEIQTRAATDLVGKIGQGFNVSLLDGVTGSGKTEVYFEAIAHALKAEPENQMVILLPEITLSVQWLERFETRFGFTPVVWHSHITPAKKRASWQAIAKGEARVVVGARSALFLPYKKLSLLIVDEEHDGSYKQEEGVIYHARDMAVARARFEKIPAVLVSATPSLESYHNAQAGKYTEISLPARHNAAVMPDVEMIDMRSAELERGAFISRTLRDQLARAVADGHQAMLFLNRRGYAPLLLCRKCGHRFQCPECTAWMVLHRGRGSGDRDKAGQTSSYPSSPRSPAPYLQCHHCNFRIPEPKLCPSCGVGDCFAACGPGVERLYEEITAYMPQARVAVMASDSMGGHQEMQDIIRNMIDKRIDILIGTQMIAKGHHFSDLAVVGVVDADLGLSGGDLRAAERTYQLLHQLSGRAGREQVRGRVYLQSFLPDHPVMKALVSGERNNFMAAELRARENAHMPPFSRLAAIIVEGEKEEQVMRIARSLAARFHQNAGMHLYGPAPAPLFMLRGKFRYRLLVKADRQINLPDRVRAWVEAEDSPSSVRVKIDIDPQSFL